MFMNKVAVGSLVLTPDDVSYNDKIRYEFSQR